MIPLLTLTTETWILEPVQSAVENRKYVAEPPAWKPPVMVAKSDTEPLTVTGFAERFVLMIGLALFTVSGSHRLVAGLLLESPK
jgi:hypothetical protein